MFIFRDLKTVGLVSRGGIVHDNFTETEATS